MQTLEGHSGWVRSVAIDKETIISGSGDKTIKIWNRKTGECMKTLEGHSHYVTSVAIDQETIISGSHDKTIQMWKKL
jgi:WD40 repeat protein